jgi:hypothetical protein
VVEDLRKILPALAADDCNGKIRLRLVLDRLRAIASDPKDPQRATAADLLKDLVVSLFGGLSVTDYKLPQFR